MIYLVEKCKPDFRAGNQLRPVAWGKGTCLETRWGAVGITKQNRTHGSSRNMCQLEVLLMSLARDNQEGLGNAGPKGWTVCVYVCIVCICVYVVGTCDMWHLHMCVYVCVCGHVCSWAHAWWRVWHQNGKIRPISSETRRVTLNEPSTCYSCCMGNFRTRGAEWDSFQLDKVRFLGTWGLSVLVYVHRVDTSTMFILHDMDKGKSLQV